MITDTIFDSVLLTGAALASIACGRDGNQRQNEQCRPNIVFILADDMGWGDLSCYGQERFETPNIDRLASEGMRFTQCYSGTAVSAPSRCCLLTGKHNGHSVIRSNRPCPPEGQFPMAEGTRTFFHDLKDAGYTTGAFGKWGLGPVGSTGDPNKMGIDKFFGFNCQSLAHSYYPDHLWDNDTKVILEDNCDEVPYGEGTYAPDLIHKKAVEFMENAVKESKPFFMFYPTTIPHAELIVPKDSIIQKFLGKFPEKPFHGCDQGMPRFRTGGYCSQENPHATFAAMITRLDVYVGQIVSKLEELGVADNTIIVFASDNGPHQQAGADPDFFNSNGPWRGYKRDVYEGGIRVPFIVKWPGKTTKGVDTDFMCTFWDVMPTIRELLGQKNGKEMDGVSLLPLLTNKKGQKKHDFLYFEFQQRDGSQAVRQGPWKLVHLKLRSPEEVYELYNLENDPEEKTDVYAENPKIVENLKKIMVREHVYNPDFPLLKGEKLRESD